MAKQRFINFGERVKRLRHELGLSQEAVGAQGLVSTPGWVKIENGQRQASEKLIECLTKWLVQSKHLRAGAAAALKEELLTLKYMGSSSPFVRELARAHASGMPGGTLLTAAAVRKPKAKVSRGLESKPKSSRGVAGRRRPRRA